MLAWAKSLLLVQMTNLSDVKWQIVNFFVEIDIKKNFNFQRIDVKVMEKIVLCDVQNKIYPNLEKIFLNLLNDSGYPGVKIEKKIDFEDLYKKRTN